MKTGSTARKLTGGIAILLLVAWQASAEIAYNFPTTLTGSQPDAAYSLGTLFTVGSTNIFVTQLATFDESANGIGGVGIDVAIYRVTLSGNAIVSGTLAVGPVTFSGTSQPLLFGTSTRLFDIPDVELGAGTYMVVANRYGRLDLGGSEVDYNPYYVAGQLNLASANPAFGVTFLTNGQYNVSYSLTWGATLPGGWNYDGPYGIDPPVPRYAAGNFEYVIPEPSGLAIACVGLLGLVCARRRAWRRCKTGLG